MSKLSGCPVEEDLPGCDNGSTAGRGGENTMGFGGLWWVPPQLWKGDLRRVLKDFSWLRKGDGVESLRMGRAL